MKEYYVLKPESISQQLTEMLDAALGGREAVCITNKTSLPDLREKKLVICAEVSPAGFCIPLYEVITELQLRGNDSLEGSSGILLIHSSNELFTKHTAATLVFLLNRLGCRFPGHPAVEATKSLSNFETWRKIKDAPLQEICLELCTRLGDRFAAYCPEKVSEPRILALHASFNNTSNTIALWNKVKANLEGCEICELHVENGKVLDCTGCPFKTCMYYSNNNSCFYGGMMVEEIFPAIERSDAIVWLCPNYNDAISANLSAVINRLTALYRRIPFYSKTVFSIIVSGNSGSDSVARQLANALCINKGFNLPPRFALMATANDPGAVEGIEGIADIVKEYAKNMLNEIKRP